MPSVGERISQLKQQSNSMLADNIVRTADGSIDKVLCWCCGAQVCGWVDNETTAIEDNNGVKTVRVKQVFRSFANYTKAHFILASGEEYSPIVCKKCVGKLTLQCGQKMFNRDIELVHRDKKEAGASLVEAMLDKTVAQFKGEHSERKRRGV